MNKSASASPDKIIVDRSRVSRNKDVAKAVRTTRERLQMHGDFSAHSDRDMLALFLTTIKQSAALPPLFVILIGLIGNYTYSDINFFPWMMASLAVHSINLLVSNRARRAELTMESAPRWRRWLLLSQTAAGICWGALVFVDCQSCGENFVFFKGAWLFIVLAAMSLSLFMLRAATLVAFTPVVIALAVQSLLTGDTRMMALTTMFAAALAFFAFITDRLYSANSKLLSYQSEKDDLIAELEMANSMSDEARRRAEEANLAKSRFLATMSHELRTPLNAILGFSEVMATEVMGPLNNPMYKEYVGDIHASGKHLLDLINEILDLSRIEAGRYHLQEETVQLVDIAEDCIGMVQLRAKAKNIHITDQFEPGMPSIWADEKAIRQVLLNILSNAVKFTPKGGEIVVKVGWTGSGGQYVSIKDNGPGISEEEIPVVLSAFGQGSIAIKSAEQGTGLGLPIVQAILHKHDGQFLLKSKLREGTEAIAVLPAKRVLQSLPAVEETPVVEHRRKSFA